MVEAGTDSGRFHRLVTIVAELALLPFALALGLDLFITVERIFGETASAAAGIVAAGAAIGLWYGFPRVRRLHVGHRETRNDDGSIPGPVEYTSSRQNRADAD